MAQEFVRDGKLDRVAAAEALRRFLEGSIHTAELDLTVTIRGATEDVCGESEAEIFADLDGKDREILLHRDGEALKAIEYLAIKVLRLHPPFHRKIHIDCGGYRALRVEELRMMARVAAERVQSSRQFFRLNPMSPEERRIVHLELKNIPGVRTESVGTGDDRQIVIHPVEKLTNAS